MEQWEKDLLKRLKEEPIDFLAITGQKGIIEFEKAFKKELIKQGFKIDDKN